MILAYVSDEHYSALHGVLAEVVDLLHGYQLELSSSASGALSAELPPGRYRITLAKDGYGTQMDKMRSPRHHSFATSPHESVSLRLYVA